MRIKSAKNIHKLGETMWYLIKQAFIPIAYLLFSSIIATGVFSIENCDPFIIVTLLIINLLFYFLVVATLYGKEGEEAYTVRLSNDVTRKRIIETGADLPLNLTKEYAPWKGFAFGGIISIPLVILLIIHTVFVLSGSNEMGAGAIAAFLYMVVFAFARIDLSVEIVTYDYYVMLIFIPLVVIVSGLSYIRGARKLERQQKRIKETQQEIYGGKR